MGFMDKVLEVMKLDPDDDFEYDNEAYEDDDIDFAPVKNNKQIDEDSFEDRKKARERVAKPMAKVTQMKPVKRTNSVTINMEVCVIRPTSIDDGREITDTLLDGRTVVLNVEGLPVDVAQRIIDFASGSCYAISGNLQKISNYIFIITPANVDISGDFQNYMDAFDVNSFRNEF